MKPESALPQPLDLTQLKSAFDGARNRCVSTTTAASGVFFTVLPLRIYAAVRVCVSLLH